MQLSTEVPGHIVLDRDPAPPGERDTAVPTYRPMSTVAKRSPISATAELLFKMASCVWTLDHPRRILGGLYRCVNTVGIGNEVLS